MKILALIDGEHYPPVTRDALLSIKENVEAAVFLGGTEKIGSIEELRSYLNIPVYTSPDSELPAIISIITEICTKHNIQQVVDLSDEPVIDYLNRFSIACRLVKEGIEYRGSDFFFTPPPSHKILENPSMMVIGTTKRVGKTAVSGYIARTLKAAGYTPCIVTMGRGGPAEPEVIRGDHIELTPSYLLHQADEGKHAASDHWENALTSRVITVGCRRCGGGMAGAPFISNVVEGAALANTVDVNFAIMEGSGVTLPPVYTDKHVVIVGAHQHVKFIEEYFGPFRILIADLVIVTMCEEPMASPEKVKDMERAIKNINPGVRQAHCVFRPRPLKDIKGRRIALTTTAPPLILQETIVPYIEDTFDCTVVGASPYLSNRPRVREDLEEMLPHADTLLTELKASAIDVVTREAVKRELDVVYMDNIPQVVGGNVKNLEDTIVKMAREVSS
ncbi:MAG: 2,3-diphosphoglycerate synthetase [Theionarchaea archaeon]|nr:2,3-diphosphoglycerate synthetase [Theionarchaea archaeon]